MEPLIDQLAAEFLIRGYTSSDWQAVCGIHDMARPQEIAAGGVDPRAFRAMADVAEVDEFFVSETLVVCIDSSVVGFVSWNGSWVTWLYVDPGFQRRGIGRRLFAEAIRRIGSEAWTNAFAGNEPALSLYRAAGMELVWTRPDVCEGYACQAVRMALPTSRMRDPKAMRQRS